MKLFLKAVVFVYTALILVACSENDDISYSPEFKQEIEVSTSWNDSVKFVSLEKATLVADLFFDRHSTGNTSTKNGFRAQSNILSTEVETVMVGLLLMI